MRVVGRDNMSIKDLVTRENSTVGEESMKGWWEVVAPEIILPLYSQTIPEENKSMRILMRKAAWGNKRHGTRTQLMRGGCGKKASTREGCRCTGESPMREHKWGEGLAGRGGGGLIVGEVCRSLGKSHERKLDETVGGKQRPIAWRCTGETVQIIEPRNKFVGEKSPMSELHRCMENTSRQKSAEEDFTRALGACAIRRRGG